MASTEWFFDRKYDNFRHILEFPPSCFCTSLRFNFRARRFLWNTKWRRVFRRRQFCLPQWLKQRRLISRLHILWDTDNGSPQCACFRDHESWSFRFKTAGGARKTAGCTRFTHVTSLSKREFRYQNVGVALVGFPLFSDEKRFVNRDLMHALVTFMRWFGTLHITETIELVIYVIEHVFMTRLMRFS